MQKCQGSKVLKEGKRVQRGSSNPWFEKEIGDSLLLENEFYELK